MEVSSSSSRAGLVRLPQRTRPMLIHVTRNPYINARSRIPQLQDRVSSEGEGRVCPL